MIDAIRSLVGIPNDSNLEYILAGTILCLSLYALVNVFKIIGRR